MTPATLTSLARQRLEERSCIDPAEFLRLLDENLTVSVGVQFGTRRRYRLLYSEADHAHYVAVQDFETGAVITVVPLDQYRNPGYAISKKSMLKALRRANPRLFRSLYCNSGKITTGFECQVTGVLFTWEERSRRYSLGRYRFETWPETPEDALGEEAFVERFLRVAKNRELPLESLEEILLTDSKSGETCIIRWHEIDAFFTGSMELNNEGGGGVSTASFPSQSVPGD